MKKVNVSLKPGGSRRSFRLFPNAEGLYVWLNDSTVDPQTVGMELVWLERDMFIEAEWEGCEIVYEADGMHTRLDNIRFVKARQSQNASGLLVTTHRGWVKGMNFPFNDYEDDDVVVRRLGRDDKQFDMDVLFKEADARSEGR